MWTIEYKLDERASHWNIIECDDEKKARIEAFELLESGYIVRMSEE